VAAAHRGQRDQEPHPFAPAAPALAKGPSRASITGPGLARPVVVSGNGETQGRLGSLAMETGLFTAMFGTSVVVAYETPQQLRTPPRATALGPPNAVDNRR
jgi:hypothetical protein